MPGTIEVVRPVAPGEGVVRADEDAAAGAELVPAGRPLRAQDLGMLAAAGVTERRRARPPAGDDLLHRRRGGAARTPRRCAPGRCATRLQRLARPRWSPRPAASPAPAAIVPDDAARAARPRCARALGASDVVVICAGSSVGARDETAGAVAALPRAGIWCHGLAIKPGKPTLLAHSDGIPVIGLPGNPRSALVVFRLIGMPLVRRVGGCTSRRPSRCCGPGSPATCPPPPAGSTSSRSALHGEAARARSSGSPRCCRCSPPPTAT